MKKSSLFILALGVFSILNTEMGMQYVPVGGIILVLINIICVSFI